MGKLAGVRVGTLLLASFALAWHGAAAGQSLSRAVLALHNAERARWQAPPLAWDVGLAAGADRWAAELARTGRWGHSPRNSRAGQGENLWMGTRGAYPLPAMLDGWLSERRWFRPAVFPAVSRTGRWTDVGHYSQMISRHSTHVGCAVRSSRRWDYLVCRYSPPGNIDGRVVP